MKGDEVDNATFLHLIESVRTIKGVQLVIELTGEKIKHREHLVF
jgi:hypothetical protein